MNSVRMAAASIVSASIASILEDRDFDSNTPQVVTVKGSLSTWDHYAEW